MPDYSKGCIYMIKKQDDYNNDNVYIGSCCNFSRRKCGHKNASNNENNQNYNIKLYKHIRENGGWNSWCMTKIIDYPCNSKSQLNTVERSYIDKYKATLNCIIPTRTNAEWRNDNKDKIKQYYVDNADKLMKQQKEYYQDNKEKAKQYYIDNADKLIKQQKEYYQDNKEKAKEYYIDNSDKIKEYNNEYQKQKVICDKCGCKVTKGKLATHKKSQKCINFNSK